METNPAFRAVPSEVSLLESGWTSEAGLSNWVITELSVSPDTLALLRADAPSTDPLRVGLETIVKVDEVGDPVDGLMVVQLVAEDGRSMDLKASQAFIHGLVDSLVSAREVVDVTDSIGMTAAASPSGLTESSTTCPYCHTEISNADEAATTKCRRCGSAHHLDCWAESTGCAIPGCEVQRLSELPPPQPSVATASHAAPSSSTVPAPVAANATYAGSTTHRAQGAIPLAPAPGAASASPSLASVPFGSTAAASSNNFTVRRDNSRLRGKRAALTCLVVALPIVSSIGTAHNWFETFTGHLTDQRTLDSKVKSGREKGRDAGYAAGYDEGETSGQADGYADGYEKGLVAGCKFVFDAVHSIRVESYSYYMYETSCDE